MIGILGYMHWRYALGIGVQVDLQTKSQVVWSNLEIRELMNNFGPRNYLPLKG